MLDDVNLYLMARVIVGGFKVFTALSIRMIVFWDVIYCTVVNRPQLVGLRWI
jgi:hypothetical protein